MKRLSILALCKLLLTSAVLLLSFKPAFAQKLAAESNSLSSYGIDVSGNLYTWGYNANGQLGIGNTTDQTTPQKVTFPTGVTGWAAVAGGDYHSLAIGNDGNLYTWGYNGYGQLGIGNTTNQTTPHKVIFPTGVTGWTAIAAGYAHSLAIGNDGNLYTWGMNSNGQLGIGNTLSPYFTPQKVTFPTGVTGWTDVVSGGLHSLAIGNDGNLYTWGFNANGQLGIGNTTDQTSPQKVTFPTGVTGWTIVAGGFSHSLAIGNDGNLYNWGMNGYGQLGIGNTTDQTTPQMITFPIGVTGWTAVAGGNRHSLAIGNDNYAYSWGDNSYSQLGTNNTTQYKVPVRVVGVGGTGDLSLPVQTTDFLAKADIGSVTLSWKTQSEVNCYGFEIQRLEVTSQKSEDDAQSVAGSWQNIGFVKGSGNRNSPKNYSFIDDNPPSGTVEYRLKQIDNDGAFKYSNEVEADVNSVPKEFCLYQNYPNPFNPSTTIKFGLQSDSKVTLEVFNTIGQKVATLVNEQMSAGYHQVVFNAGNLASGIYFYRLQTNGFVSVKKLLLLK